MVTIPPAEPEPEHDHMSWEDVEKFLSHTEQPLERKPLFHVLAVCDACRRATEPLLELYRRGKISGYVTLLDLEALISEHEAPALWQQLEAEFAPEERRLHVMSDRLRADPRWPTWGLVVWLARQSLARADLEPDKAFLWCTLAELGAIQLPADGPAPEEWLEELRAFVAAVSGHVYLVRGDLDMAETRFEHAHEHLEASEDPADYLPLRPYVYELEAHLRRTRGRGWQLDALHRLDQALEAWAVVERQWPEDRARVLVARAEVLTELDRGEEARKAYAEAGELLGVSADPGALEAALRTRRDG